MKIDGVMYYGPTPGFDFVGKIKDAMEVILIPKKPVEIGSFRYDYFPWSVSLQALVSKEKRLYGLPNNFPVNDPNFVDTIRKLYADWKREANKSFDPIRNKYPVVFEEE